MSYYEDVYLKRLNRYGLNYQSRIQGERERMFDLFLLKTLYRVDFEYEGELVPASFEKYKQDDTKTLHYLLTKVDVNIPPGTILFIPDKDNELKPWMVYWLEEIKASGYNRYIMLRMSHFIRWRGRDKKVHSSWAYMYGQEDNMLKDEIRSRSRMDTIYTENLKTSFFILPLNQYIKRDDYLEIGSGDLKEAYRVTGYDIQSSEGVQYVTVDPVYLRDHTPAPTYNPEEDNADDFFWLEGGNVNGD